MHCSFCDNPAAHPATGTVYSVTMIACYYCSASWNAWLVRHTNSKGRRKGPNFYDYVTRKEPNG